MNLNFLSSVFLLVVISFQISNCMAQVDAKVKKAKNICNAAYIKAVALPDINSLLFSSSSFGTGSSSGSTKATNDPVSLTFSVNSNNSFQNPQTISALNVKGSTLTGTISNKDDVHIWTYSGLSTIDSWQIKFDSATEALCKAGSIYTVTSATTINEPALNVLVTTSPSPLTATTLVKTYIVCTSKYNSQLTSPATSGSFSSVSYSINLYQDTQTNSTTANANPLLQIQQTQQAVKETKALLALLACYSDAEIANEVKNLILF